MPTATEFLAAIQNLLLRSLNAAKIECGTKLTENSTEDRCSISSKPNFILARA